MYNSNSEVIMKELRTYMYVKNGKRRKITTYNKTKAGLNMRENHQHFLQHLQSNYQLDYSLAYAYLPNQSVKKLIEKHQNDHFFYTFDIKDFFGSINHQMLIEKMIHTDKDLCEQIIYQCSNNKPSGLAIGLIPSPYLSNLYLSDFDKQLFTYLKTISSTINYSRYSDDLLISSTNQLPLNEIEEKITLMLKLLKLELNLAKSRQISLLKHHDYFRFLGVNIVRGKEDNYLTISRSFKRKTTKELNLTRKTGMQLYIDIYK